ncbi:MAG: hypothetical protein ACSHXF_16665 [Aquaticitalea sp.]
MTMQRYVNLQCYNDGLVFKLFTGLLKTMGTPYLPWGTQYPPSGTQYLPMGTQYLPMGTASPP